MNSKKVVNKKVVSKTLSNVSEETTIKSVSDVVSVGVSQNTWMLLCKTYSKKEGWMKSTKALNLSTNSCLVQTTTQQKNNDGTYSLCDSLVVVSGRVVETEEKGIYMISN